MGARGRISCSQGHLGERTERQGGRDRAMGESTLKKLKNHEGIGYWSMLELVQTCI